MNIMKRLLFSIAVCIALFSCSSRKIITQSLSANKVSDDIYNYYVNESKISYQIFSDSENLYVNLKTSDKMTIIKILKSGLSIYFDEKGKTSKAVSIEYPLHNSKLNFSDLRQKENGNSQPKLDINRLLESVPNEAVFKNKEEIEHFSLDLNSTDISISLKTIKSELEDILIYQLKIPFRNISTLPISEIENLSIGIVSGKIEPPKRSQGVNSGMPNGSGRPSGVGGGRPAGVGGGRPSGSGRPSRVGRKPSNLNSEITKPISIWIDLKLNKQEK